MCYIVAYIHVVHHSVCTMAVQHPSVIASQRYFANRTHRVLTSMKCPISKELFVDPVMASDGYTYERWAIEDYLKSHTTSPQIEGHRLTDHLKPHRTMATLVQSFLDKLFCSLDPFKFKLETMIHHGGDNDLYYATYSNEPVAASESREARDGALVTTNAARTMGRLSLHPNIIGYIGVCALINHEGPVPRLFIVTELAPFGSLLNLLYGRVGHQRYVNALSLTHKVTMMTQICAGMAHLARHNELHRDLAARNVLVFAFDENDPRKTVVKIADFEHAVNTYDKHSYYVGPSALLPQRGVGHHTAPDLIKGGTFSSADDVWAFGVTCIEILTIQRLPANATDAEVTAHMKDEYLTGVTAGVAPSRPAQCPEALWVILKTCFNTERNERARFKDLVPLLTQYL